MAGELKSALDGVLFVLATRFSMRLHFITAIVAIFLAILLKIPALELISVLTLIAIVMCLEMVNQLAIRIVEIVSPDNRALGKRIKNLGEGMILIATIVTLVVFIIIFFPRLYVAFSR